MRAKLKILPRGTPVQAGCSLRLCDLKSADPIEVEQGAAVLFELVDMRNALPFRSAAHHFSTHLWSINVQTYYFSTADDH